MKSKKILAIVLATSMMFGSSITALADGATGTTGAGKNEGHVEKEVINVVLPTIADGSTPFAYTMDPERLITATNNAHYSGATFPSANDTGVYFLTETNTYANTSNELTITNKSSCDVDVSVKVKAVASEGGKDIALAESSTVSTTEGSPDLYLGLKVGSDTTTVKTEEQTITKKVEGVASNFEIVYDSGYKYQEKSDASGWKDLKLSMTGAVSEMDVPAGTTAPTISVTWSFAKHVDNAAPSIATTTYTMTAGTDVDINVDLGAGDLAAEGVASVVWNSTDLLAASSASYSNGVVTIDSAAVDYLLSDDSLPRTIVITFDDEDATEVTITLASE